MPAHDVVNQPPPLQDYNLFEENRPLVEALRREGAAWAEGQLQVLGKLAGGEPLRWGTLANDNPPVLRSHDRYGHRIDEVEFHPSWHWLVQMAVEHSVHALPWREPRPGAHAARAAMMMLMSGVEAGHGCPISMTYAAVPALRTQPDVAAEWESPLTSSAYDPRLMPVADKAGALCGLAMTEKQGGSDVRANTTEARPLAAGGTGGEYLLTGHKWFCSAPMCDAFVVLAQTKSGPSCFLLPRVLPDGARNSFLIQRLKDKLGNRSNASSEVEFEQAWARLIGQEGRGVQTIGEMVNYTRLDCVLGSAGTLRAAVSHATHHAAHRTAFGKLLIDHPLMQNVLADLCLESEAATLMAMRLARACDDAVADEALAPFRRLSVAVGKYWVCKSAVQAVAESIECLGGNGYVEESGMPRLYREIPLNSIWEGSGNVNCLDVLRVLRKSPESIEAFFEDVRTAAGADSRFDRALRALESELPAVEEATARKVVEMMALVLQGSLLLQCSPPAVADAFCSSRLSDEAGRALGTLPAATAFTAIIERHRPLI